MNLHQFRFVREAVRQNFNLTEAAKALYTSQPGVSKAIIELEDELGVEIFRRHGKRVRSLTEPGRLILASVERILREVESLKRIGNEFAAQDQGNLTIAATHTQARYALPEAIAEFRRRFPKVRVSIVQGNPTQVAEMVQNDAADIGIATEALADYPDLSSLPCFQWHHVAVFRPDHPLAERATLSLEDLMQYPLITYGAAFAGRTKINEAFARRSLTPDIVLEAIDSDVIKTYVELGLGVGIMADMAYHPERDKHLRTAPVGHLFGSNLTRIALKQGAYLRSYVYTLVELLSPETTRKLLDQALQGTGEHYEI
ncbi:CysB family HTH-type transcriptional regulator [Chitinasiproducens palmae]|uniref:Transcriptional regulator, LysR family n=1 Tax=Chitinasiproducens palmae TaxID=1770053 RepID=A0A1H2PP40_9BURK|nr:CysB family HTH-type transcriptional regulator [Chitinasiproducens palmae]SDV48023.1 transcriptional regulator, LysR family [Chitinasiproducens palmae]